MTAPVNPEGQTAQEVRHLSRIPFTPWCGADEPNQRTTDSIAYSNCLACFRALASTPSPAKQEQKIASAEGAASKLGAAPATPLERDVREFVDNLHAYASAVHIQFCSGKQAHDGVCSATIEIAEQADALFAAPAQPDARDAEIARLTRELAEAKFSPLGDNHHNAAKCPHCGDPLRAAQAEVARLTKELEEARADAGYAGGALVKEHAHRRAAEAQAKALREALKTARENLVHAAIQFASHYGEEDNTQRMRGAIAVLDHALAPTEPKAETPAETHAETAGQKEGP